jgi:hypothetical protein
VLYFFFGGVGDTPLADGFDAFCFGGPSFLGFRVSLPFGIFQFLRWCTCSQPNGGATMRVRLPPKGCTGERAEQIGPAGRRAGAASAMVAPAANRSVRVTLCLRARDRSQLFGVARCLLRCLFISNMLTDFLPKIFASLSSPLICRRSFASCRSFFLM